MGEPSDPSPRFRRSLTEIEQDPGLAHPFGDRPADQLPEDDTRQWRIGVAAWFGAILLGMIGGAFYGPVGLGLFALTIVVPGLLARFKFGWTHYEIGVAIGFAATVGFVIVALLLMLGLAALAVVAGA